MHRIFSPGGIQRTRINIYNHKSKQFENIQNSQIVNKIQEPTKKKKKHKQFVTSNGSSQTKLPIEKENFPLKMQASTNSLDLTILSSEKKNAKIKTDLIQQSAETHIRSLDLRISKEIRSERE